MKLTAKRMIAELEAALPAGYRLIPEVDDHNRAWSCRIATPHRYPDGETFYAYVEVNDGNKHLVRVHDDEVMIDWLSYHECWRAFHRFRNDLRKKVLDPWGVQFTRKGEGVSVAVPLAEAPHAIDRLARAVMDLIAAIKEAKQTRSTDNVSPVALEEEGELVAAA